MIVGDKTLSLEEINEIIPEDASAEDSTFLADRFVDAWIREQILLIKAEDNLPEDAKDFEKELEDYRNSLLSYHYEKAVVDQNLDTLVSDQEIKDYYETNQDNFLLKDYILRARFCTVEKEVKPKDDFRKYFVSEKGEDLVKWEQLCVDYNANYYFNDEEWIYFSELVENLPIQTFNVERFLKNNKVVEFEDDEKLYFLKILEYKLKDGLSPLSLQRDNIKNIIINQRKNKLISDMKDELYNDAVKKGTVKWKMK